MLKIVRLSLQDRPPPNTNHLYIENTIKVSRTTIFFLLSAVYFDYVNHFRSDFSLDSSFSLSICIIICQCRIME
jgi:hypothetical protein